MDLLATGILLGVGGMIIVVFLIALLDKVAGEPDMSDIVAQYIKEAPMRRLLAMRRMLDAVIEERRYNMKTRSGSVYGKGVDECGKEEDL